MNVRGLNPSVSIAGEWDDVYGRISVSSGRAQPSVARTFPILGGEALLSGLNSLRKALARLLTKSLDFGERRHLFRLKHGRL